MSRSIRAKFYVVHAGQKISPILKNWDECKNEVQMARRDEAKYKRFRSLEEAEQWIENMSRLPLIADSSSTFLPSASSQVESGRSCMSAEIVPVDVEEGVTVKRAAQQAVKVSGRGVGSKGSTDVLSPAEVKDLRGDIAETPPVQSVVKLSPEQMAIFDRAHAGANVFFTGSAGTGKSVLLHEIIAHFRREGKDVAVTATTGIAAVNIGGCTLHSWAGIGLGTESRSKFVRKVRGNDNFQSVWKRWQRTSTLIIDEISMLDGGLFDKLESIARKLREDGRPFGGIQLILCGDFCQLPPVSERDAGGEQIAASFAFDSLSWNKCVGKSMALTTVFRQKDQRFIRMLNEMRYGRLSFETIRVFRRLSRNVKYDDGIEPTELYATRREVMRANAIRLGRLETEERTFQSVDQAGHDTEARLVSKQRMQQLLERLLCQETVTLKVGAQVMLIKNLDQCVLVNGSVGRVTRFATLADFQREEATAPEEIIGVTDALRLHSTQPALGQEYPVVQFTNGLERMITPTEFDITNAEGDMEARRTQIPLILAWALSVHKSQGQTLERVKVDLRRIFERGQAYVAVSRATRLDQLQVLNFEPAKVLAHERVLEWYRGEFSSGAA